MDRWRLLLAVLTAAALARYAAACCFIHPFGDDFSYAVAGMRTDLLPRLRDEFMHWNGRWASNPLVLRGPLLLGMDSGLLLYRAVPVALLALAWLGWRAFLRAAWPSLKRTDALLGAALLLLISLHLLPDVGEGLYWYTGSVSYMLPGALALFVVAFWLRAYSDDWRMPAARLAGAVALALFIAGCSELHMVFMVVLHAVVLAVQVRDRGRPLPGILIALVLVLIAGAAMALAPGNAVRGAQFPMRHDLLRSLGWGGLQTMRFLGTWLLSPALLAAALIVFARKGSRARSAQRERAMPSTARLLAFITGLVFIAMTLPYWTTGLLGQHRTANATLLFVLPFAVLALLASGRTRFAKIPAGIERLAWALFFAAVFFTGSGGRLSNDLFSGRFARFDEQLIRRYALIEEAVAHGEERIVVPALVDPPATAHYMELSGNAEHWVNRSKAQYFGADALRLTVEQSSQ